MRIEAIAQPGKFEFDNLAGEPQTTNTPRKAAAQLISGVSGAGYKNVYINMHTQYFRGERIEYSFAYRGLRYSVDMFGTW